MVGAKNESGIKVLAEGVKMGSKVYTHEIKVFAKGLSDWRVFGKLNEHGKIIFDKLRKGLH
jgi:hypothetical protein